MYSSHRKRGGVEEGVSQIEMGKPASYVSVRRREERIEQKRRERAQAGRSEGPRTFTCPLSPPRPPAHIPHHFYPSTHCFCCLNQGSDTQHT